MRALIAQQDHLQIISMTSFQYLFSGFTTERKMHFAVVLVACEIIDKL